MEFPMPTFIAFSGNRGDHIQVEGTSRRLWMQ